MEFKSASFHGSFIKKESNDISKYLKVAAHHAKVLFTGFKRMIFGAATAGAFAMAGYGFIAIPAEDGYVAVCEFIMAVMTLGVALACMYAQGKPGNKCKKG